MRKPGLAHALLFVGLLTTSLAQAHLTLLEPLARTDDVGLTQDPCGRIPSSTSVASYPPGATIEITVDLVVNHVNSLQVVISHDNFASRRVLATISTSRLGTYKITVPLPKQPQGPAVLQVTDGTYVSCADITLSETDSFKINAAISDAWFFPDTSGQGFFIIVWENSKLIFLSWFTYEMERPPEDITAILGESGHRWLTALGPYDGDTALLDVFQSSGMIFDSADPVVDTVQLEDATIKIVWTGCNEGVLKYDIPSLGLMGEIPIERIVLDKVAACMAAQVQ